MLITEEGPDMTITPPPIHSYETPTYSELANDFRSWVDWLWRTW